MSPVWNIAVGKVATREQGQSLQGLW